MCLQMLGSCGSRSEIYLYCGDEVQEGKTVSLNSLPQKHLIPAHMDNEDENSIGDVMITEKVKIKGIVYEKGTVLVRTWEHMCDPELVKIDMIVVMKEEKYFICNKLDILDFHSERNSFEVRCSTDMTVFQYEELKYVWPQICHYSRQQCYIMLQNVDDVWGL